MRIYIQPSYDGDSVDESVRTAQEILLDSATTSVRPREIIDDRGAFLIAACDVTKALAVLKEAGRRPVLD